MLMADVQHDYSRTTIQPLDELDSAAADALYSDMESEASVALEGEGFGVDRRAFSRVVAVRYSGQEHSVTVDYPSDGTDPRSVIREEFDRLHLRQYGHTMDDPIEITTLRLHAVGVVDKPDLPQVAARTTGDSYPTATRTVTLPDESQAEYALVARESLLAGDVVEGPAVITEHTATTVMHAGDRLEVGPYGELVISIQKGA
jgi:N-methylhydantoinase A